VIVGAGPAGLALAGALWHRGVHDVLLLDRTGRPCQRFFERTDQLRQRVLRSPYEHHPGTEGHRDCELLDFSRLHWSLLTPVERRQIRMAQAGHRSVVPVDVFEAYCAHVAALHGVDGRTWPASVRELVPASEGVTVSAEGRDAAAGDYEIAAQCVVLCAGEERRNAPGTWWDGSRPRQVTYWDEDVPEGPERVVVVGGGLTAAHLITDALASGRKVEWVLRAEAERYQCSDVNASFFRAEGRARFDGAAWDDRLELMRMHRRATVMFEFRPLLRAAEESGRLTVHRRAPVTRITGHPDGTAIVRTDSGDVTGDHVILALGTVPSIGRGLLPAEVIGDRDGWPDLDESTLAYRRAPRVFTMGAAACMILGPAARNIDGHRVAAARVAAAITARLAAGDWALADTIDETLDAAVYAGSGAR